MYLQTVPSRLVLGKHVKFLVFQALWTIPFMNTWGFLIGATILYFTRIIYGNL